MFAKTMAPTAPQLKLLEQPLMSAICIDTCCQPTSPLINSSANEVRKK